MSDVYNGVIWSLYKKQQLSAKFVHRFFKKRFNGSHDKWISKDKLHLKIKILLW
jgi:hypothetical protein